MAQRIPERATWIENLSQALEQAEETRMLKVRISKYTYFYRGAWLKMISLNRHVLRSEVLALLTIMSS